MMHEISEKAFAKVNLTLDVLRKREDGYHDICTVMQTVSLHDDVLIRVGTKQEWRVLCDCADDAPLPQNDGNLAWKAAKVFFEKTGIISDGIEITICKQIPSQAGLGGGSADAAAVLRGLNRFYHDALSRSELCELGFSVGADVPFCVLCGTALAEGRGEVLTPLAPAPRMFLVICKPNFAISTAQLYQKIDESVIEIRPDHNKLISLLSSGDYFKIGDSLCNVFEPLVCKDHAEIEQIKQIMYKCNACGAQMTGSGSAVFGIFQTQEAASSACESLKQVYCNTYFATTESKNG